MAERDHFYRQARRTNTELHWSRYKSLRNQVTAMIRKAKSSYNGRIIEENSDDPKNFWKAVKKVLPNKSVTPQPSASIEPITVDGKTTTDALTIANGFCTYFTNVVESCFLVFYLLTGTSWAQKHVWIIQVNLCSLWNQYQLRLFIVNLGCFYIERYRTWRNSSPFTKGCGSKHLSYANSHNKSFDFFCSFTGGMEICKGGSTL